MNQTVPTQDLLRTPRLMVVGDLMVDRYLSGRIDRISPEAPVPVLKLEDEHVVLGGASNVIQNLVALGARPVVVGVVGADDPGRLLKEKIEALGLSPAGIVEDPERPTTLKTRVTSGTQQLLRIDREADRPICPSVIEKTIDLIFSELNRCDAVVLSDYGKGLLSAEVLQRTIGEALNRKKRVFVDPKGRSFDKYRGASFITPNRAEAEQVAGGTALDSEEALCRAASDWIRSLNLEGMLITLGKEGIFVAAGQDETFRSTSIEAEEREVYDVTGAGDTVIAAFSLMLTAGLDLFEAARWANLAAGVVVGKSGAATATLPELLCYAERFEPWQRKVKTVEELGAVVAEARRRGRRIVFTNGCFDLLHIGHIQLLHAARRMGDRLVVGLNSDESVRRLKGEGRPLIPEKERLQILASLDCVDDLVVYSEPTPKELIEKLHPDILVKGANYPLEEVSGHEIVERYGGRVERVPIQSEVSVTGLVNHIVQQFGKENR